MKIEWLDKTKIPFSHVSAGQCFLDDNDNVCIACEDYWVAILATGEIYEPSDPNGYMVTPINAKIVIE